MAKSLNKVQLIGNLTRDPEMRYTPQGTAVCTFGIATNRQWTTESGEKKDEADFHNIVSWNKLAEICAQLLKKGSIRRVIQGKTYNTSHWNIWHISVVGGQPKLEPSFLFYCFFSL